MDKLAICILNWNGKKLLEEFLPSVVENSKDYPIYLIDNQSTDDYLSLLQEKFPDVRIIQNSENYGFAKGYNIGLQSIEAEYFCLLNSDVEVSKNWIEPVLQLFDTDKNISAIQPKILSYRNKDEFEYAGAAGGFIDNLGYPYCRGRLFSTIEKDTQQYDDSIEIFWASGACLFIRAQDYWAADGFDEDFEAHMEEIDLCWRLKNRGKKIMYCGESTVYHLGAATLKKDSYKKMYLNYRNSLWMNLKNLPKNRLFPYIFARLSLDGIAAIAFLPSKGFSHLRAVFWSHMHFYRGLKKMYRKREPHPIKNYYQTKFLVYQYFITAKRKFTDLHK